MDIPEAIWRWILYLKRRIWTFEREAQISKIEISKSAAVATKAQKKLDIATHRFLKAKVLLYSEN